MKIVALEEHIATAEVTRGWKSVDPRWSDLVLKLSTEGEGARRLLDLGAERLKAIISEYFRQHVYVKPSGLFSHRDLHWALEMLGVL